MLFKKRWAFQYGRGRISYLPFLCHLYLPIAFQAATFSTQLYVSYPSLKYFLLFTPSLTGTLVALDFFCNRLLHKIQEIQQNYEIKFGLKLNEVLSARAVSRP